MQVYLVGGAVRDAQLGLPVSERDWCVVGSTPEEMIAMNYRPVGKDFPVFLHPDTGEEYALARTERKTSAGYHGFAFDTSPDVTIEEDLKRRDISINAIAQDEDGALIDPHGGLADIASKTIRHVSASFAEDPVRVLRVAKFAARFYAMGFRIAAETMGLMRDMVASGEVSALVPDRVWKETEHALCGSNCRVFFEVLRDCGALAVIYPEIDRLFGVPQKREWHPEIDTGLHTMMVLDQAERLSSDGDVRFAALVHDLGKGTTRKQDLPGHPGHERRSMKLVDKLCERFPVPKAYRELGRLVANYHLHSHRAFELRADTVLRVIEAADAFRRPERFDKFLLACEADARGRKGLEDRDYEQADYLRRAFDSAKTVDAAAIAEKHAGGDIPGAIRRARVASIEALRREVRQARTE